MSTNTSEAARVAGKDIAGEVMFLARELKAPVIANVHRVGRPGTDRALVPRGIPRCCPGPSGRFPGGERGPDADQCRPVPADQNT